MVDGEDHVTCGLRLARRGMELGILDDESLNGTPDEISETLQQLADQIGTGQPEGPTTQDGP